MTRGVRIGILILLVAISSMVAWQVLRPQAHEPAYQGRRLTFWLHEHCRLLNTGGNKVAASAVRKMGADAIPTLLGMISRKDSTSLYRLRNLWTISVLRIPYLPVWMHAPKWYRNQDVIVNMEAAEGFRLLGVDAQQAVPALIGIYEKNISEQSQAAILRALNGLGPAAGAAIPSLLREAGSTNEVMRSIASAALSQVHADPRLVVPELVRFLSDARCTVRWFAANDLAGFGSDARSAIPALVQRLNDPDQDVCDALTNALLRIDPEAAAKVGVE